MTAPRYYKWTDDQGRSCHGGNHDWVAEPTLTVTGKIEPCRHGIPVATAAAEPSRAHLEARDDA